MILLQLTGYQLYTQNTNTNKDKKIPLNLGSWNVRTLQESANSLEGKMALVTKVLNKYNIDIAALSEIQLPDYRQLEEKGEGHTFFQSGKMEDVNHSFDIGYTELFTASGE